MKTPVIITVAFPLLFLVFFFFLLRKTSARRRFLTNTGRSGINKTIIIKVYITARDIITVDSRKKKKKNNSLRYFKRRNLRKKNDFIQLLCGVYEGMSELSLYSFFSFFSSLLMGCENIHISFRKNRISEGMPAVFWGFHSPKLEFRTGDSLVVGRRISFANVQSCCALPISRYRFSIWKRFNPS